MVLPHNEDIVKARALKTFIDGLAELGIDKRLIQNKRILAELLDKEQAYHDKDSEAGDEEMVSESSDNEDDTDTASEISEHQESENPDLEPEGNSEILRKGKDLCCHCNGENVYKRVVVKCPRCLWHDGCRICPICTHQIPVDRKHLTDGFIWCADCHAVKTLIQKI